jgi:hypothetical protein
MDLLQAILEQDRSGWRWVPLSTGALIGRHPLPASLSRGVSFSARFLATNTLLWSIAMDPHERAVSVWYRTAGLATRNQKDLALEIIEAEIRSTQHEVWLEAAKMVLTGEPIEIARHMRARAEVTIRPKRNQT